MTPRRYRVTLTVVVAFVDVPVSSVASTRTFAVMLPNTRSSVTFFRGAKW